MIDYFPPHLKGRSLFQGQERTFEARQTLASRVYQQSKGGGWGRGWGGGWGGGRGVLPYGRVCRAVAMSIARRTASGGVTLQSPPPSLSRRCRASFRPGRRSAAGCVAGTRARMRAGAVSRVRTTHSGPRESHPVARLRFSRTTTLRPAHMWKACRVTGLGRIKTILLYSIWHPTPLYSTLYSAQYTTTFWLTVKTNFASRQELSM